MALAASLLCRPTAALPSWTPRDAARPPATTTPSPCPLPLMPVRWWGEGWKDYCSTCFSQLQLAPTLAAPALTHCHCDHVRACTEEFLKENIKSTAAMKGQAVFSIAKVDPVTGEIAGVFESVQPSDTDLGYLIGLLPRLDLLAGFAQGKATAGACVRRDAGTPACLSRRSSPWRVLQCQGPQGREDHRPLVGMGPALIVEWGVNYVRAVAGLFQMVLGLQLANSRVSSVLLYAGMPSCRELHDLI